MSMKEAKNKECRFLGNVHFRHREQGHILKQAIPWMCCSKKNTGTTAAGTRGIKGRIVADEEQRPKKQIM